jgi:uncharacterized protein YegL
MKSKLIAATLFAATTVTVALFPYVRDTVAANPPPRLTTPPVAIAVAIKPKVEVVFVLDTTSSMSGLIEAAKEKIWSIASTMASANQSPEVRMGLVAFRDRGDAYVTKVVDLSSDLDSMYATLMDFRAEGGGDGPESVNQGLYDAVHRVSWSQDEKTYRAVFLLGDAPPHMDYDNDVPYPQTLKAAAQRGIVVNAIQAGKQTNTLKRWQDIAQLGYGSYFQVGQKGSLVAISTPFDEKLAKLSRRLDSTRLFYGNEQEKAAQRVKRQATKKLHAKASVAAQARRGAFNASASGAANLLGDKDLVDDVKNGRADLKTLAPESLPAALQSLEPAEQKAKVEELAKQRLEVRQRMVEVSKKRDAFLKEKVEAQGGARDSLDHRLFDAVRTQGGKVGLSYEADAPRY